jgi:ComF family protein
VRRCPVCGRCIASVEPLDTELCSVSCRTPFQNPFLLDLQGRCPLCRTGLRGFDAAYSLGAYEGALRQLVDLYRYAYRYARIKTLARPLGDLRVRAMPCDGAVEAPKPVPLHWRRRWTRGFNHAELLPRALPRRNGVPILKALARTHSTKTQAGLSNHTRREDGARAFRARPVEGRRLLLIDDVRTTGSTAACALALQKAGASRVALLTVARADRRIPAAQPETVDSIGGRG